MYSYAFVNDFYRFSLQLQTVFLGEINANIFACRYPYRGILGGFAAFFHRAVQKHSGITYFVNLTLFVHKSWGKIKTHTIWIEYTETTKLY